MGEKSFAYTFGNTTYNLASRTYIMGILNVTPDSFSDGGLYLDPERAVERGLEMVDEGADFIDVGGESTRPKGAAYGEGAKPVSEEEELRRILPVISELVRQTDAPISVDTYKAGVARKALEAGASIVNDISGFRFDTNMAETVSLMGASVVLMHTRGAQKTLQSRADCEELLREVKDYLRDGIRLAQGHGIEQIIVDPGIGFGKGRHDNLWLLNHLAEFEELGFPILVGTSRKSFIGEILNLPVEERIEGSIAAAVSSVMMGANIVRVHDVAEIKYAITLADAVKNVALN